MRNLKAFVVLVLVTIFAFPVLSNEPEKDSIFKPIDPMTSSIEEFGNTMSVPFVNINEYTGKVSSTLGSFGSGKLPLSLHYLQNVFEASSESQQISMSNTGLGKQFHWNIGYLAVNPYRPSTNSSNNSPANKGHNLEVVLVERGTENNFYRDTVFQTKHPALNGVKGGNVESVIICSIHNSEHRQAVEHLYSTGVGELPCVDPSPNMDNHFLDADGRRLQRLVFENEGKRRPLFGLETYQLVDNDGTVTTFYPASDNMTFATYLPAYYYPVRKVFPNGEMVEIRYNGIGIYGLTVPEDTDELFHLSGRQRGEFKPQFLRDSLSRGLIVHYGKDDTKLSSFGKPIAVTQQTFINPVKDSSPDNYFEPDRCKINQGTCQLFTNIFYDLNIIEMSSALGHKTSYEFRPLAENENGYSPGSLLEKVTSPTGGIVDLAYDAIELPKVVHIPRGHGEGGTYCPVESNTNCVFLVENYYASHRVTHATYQGMRYDFSYRVASESDLPELRPFTAKTDAHLTQFRVDVKGYDISLDQENTDKGFLNKNSGSAIYHRTTFYHHHDMYLGQPRVNTTKDLIGHALGKNESYVNSSGQKSGRSEHFIHEAFEYTNSDAVYEFGEAQGNGDTHKVTRLKSHRIKKDGVWVVSHKEYHRALIQSIPKRNHVHSVYFHSPQPRSIVRYMEGQSSTQRLWQNLGYDDLYFKQSVGSAGIDFDKVYEVISPEICNNNPSACESLALMPCNSHFPQACSNVEVIKENYKPTRIGALASIESSIKSPGINQPYLNGRYKRAYVGNSSRLHSEKFYTRPDYYYQKTFDYDWFQGNGFQVSNTDISGHNEGELRLNKGYFSNTPIGSSTIEEILSYQFGVPREINLPDSGKSNPREISRNLVDFLGRTLVETNHGVITETAYDKDGRVTEKKNINSDVNTPDAPVTYQYSLPYDLSSPVLPSDFSSANGRTNFGWQLERKGEISDVSTNGSLTLVDRWGRTIRSTSKVTNDVIPVNDQYYSAIGLPVIKQLASGATSETVHDIWGRPVTKTVRDASGNELSTNHYYYRLQGNGISETILSRTVTDRGMSSELSDVTGGLSEGGSRALVRHMVSDFFGRPIQTGVERDTTFNGTGTPSISRYVRYQYAIDDNSALVTNIIPDCSIESNIACASEQQRTRSTTNNWLGQLVYEFHPEYSVSGASLASSCEVAFADDGELSSGSNAGIQYYYDFKGQLEQTVDPLGSTHFEYYPSGKQKKITRFECGQERVVGEFEYDELHRLTRSANGPLDGSQSLIDEFVYDGLNRPTNISTDMPMPAPAPSALTMTETAPNGAVTKQFKWTGDSAQYLLEVKRNDLEPVVFEIENSTENLSINRALFLAQAERTASNSYSQYVTDAERDDGDFFNPSAQYLWRVTGLSQDYEPTVPTDWTPLSELPSARLELSSQAINFGPVAYNKAHSARLTVKNLSGREITISPSELASPFSARLISQSATIAPDETLVLSIAFSPPGAGQFEGQLNLSVNGAVAESVTLSGEGVPQAASSASIILSGQPIHTSVGESTVTTFDIQNNTGTSLQAVVELTADREFSESTISGGGQVVLPAPTGNSVSRVGVQLNTNGLAMGQETLIIKLLVSGEVVDTKTIDVYVDSNIYAGALAVNKTSIDFGDVEQGQSYSDFVIVTNGQKHSVITNLSIKLFDTDGNAYRGSVFKLVPTDTGYQGACRRVAGPGVDLLATDSQRSCHVRVSMQGSQYASIGAHEAILIIERQERDENGALTYSTKRIFLRGSISVGADVYLGDYYDPERQIIRSGTSGSLPAFTIRRGQQLPDPQSLLTLVNRGQKAANVVISMVENQDNLFIFPESPSNGTQMSFSLHAATYNSDGTINCTNNSCGYARIRLGFNPSNNELAYGSYRAKIRVSWRQLDDNGRESSDQEFFEFDVFVNLIGGTVLVWDENNQYTTFPDAAAGTRLQLPLDISNEVDFGVPIDSLEYSPIFESVSLHGDVNLYGSGYYIHSSGTTPSHDYLEVVLAQELANGTHQGEVCLNYSGESLCKTYTVTVVDEFRIHFDESFFGAGDDRILVKALLEDRDHEIVGQCAQVWFDRKWNQNREAIYFLEGLNGEQTEFYFNQYSYRYPYILRNAGDKEISRMHYVGAVQVCAPPSAAGEQARIRVQIQDRDTGANVKEYFSKPFYTLFNNIDIDFPKEVVFSDVGRTSLNYQPVAFVNLNASKAKLRLEYDAPLSVLSGGIIENGELTKLESIKSIRSFELADNRSSIYQRAQYNLTLVADELNTNLAYVKIYNAEGGLVNGKAFDFIRVRIEQRPTSAINSGISVNVSSINLGEVHVNELKRGYVQVVNNSDVVVVGMLSYKDYVSQTTQIRQEHRNQFFKIPAQSSVLVPWELHVNRHRVSEGEFNTEIYIKADGHEIKTIPVISTVVGEPVRLPDPILSDLFPSSSIYWDPRFQPHGWDAVVGRTYALDSSSLPDVYQDLRKHQEVRYSIPVESDIPWTKVNDYLGLMRGTRLTSSQELRPTFNVEQVNYTVGEPGTIKVPVVFSPSQPGRHGAYLEVRNGERVYRFVDTFIEGYAIADPLLIDGLNYRGEFWRQYADSDLSRRDIFTGEFLFDENGRHVYGYSPQYFPIGLTNSTSEAMTVSIEREEDSFTERLWPKLTYWWLNQVKNETAEYIIQPGERITTNAVIEECSSVDSSWYCSGFNTVGLKIRIDGQPYRTVMLRSWGGLDQEHLRNFDLLTR
ncbi:choice-of-anchor D domain-containing protein [Aliikangiella sp. IMCC44359]|uniref:choice-of-anchor D domain-containing protein n=1 Tax=Aliikangiella sp. IMCC44359 TaxID=3459125 RepID=UPI00403B29FD